MTTPDGGRDASLAGPGLRAFARIADAWGLDDHQQLAILGRPLGEAFAQLEEGTSDDLFPETLERISCVLGIYRALHILFPQQQQADSWIRRPNTGGPFRGSTALSLMCSGRLVDLAVVREYLEAQGLAEP